MYIDSCKSILISGIHFSEVTTLILFHMYVVYHVILVHPQNLSATKNFAVAIMHDIEDPTISPNKGSASVPIS